MENNNTKKCPYCAEDIKIEAIKCKHCGSNIKEKEPIKTNKMILVTKNEKPKINTGVIVGTIFFAGIILSVIIIAIAQERKENLEMCYKNIKYYDTAIGMFSCDHNYQVPDSLNELSPTYIKKPFYVRHVKNLIFIQK